MQAWHGLETSAGCVHGNDKAAWEEHAAALCRGQADWIVLSTVLHKILLCFAGALCLLCIVACCVLPCAQRMSLFNIFIFLILSCVSVRTLLPDYQLLQEERVGFVAPTFTPAAPEVTFVSAQAVRKHVEARGWVSRFVPLRSDAKIMPLHLLPPNGP